VICDFQARKPSRTSGFCRFEFGLRCYRHDGQLWDGGHRRVCCQDFLGEAEVMPLAGDDGPMRRAFEKFLKLPIYSRIAIGKVRPPYA
jgi:hypothetical protein